MVPVMAKPGDPFLDVYTAAWYNKVDKRVNKNITGIPALQNLSQQSYIWVANHEAVAKDQFTVVALDDPTLLVSDRLDSITKETVWNTKDLDDEEPDNIFILLDPLPPEIGAEARALVCGVSLLKVDTVQPTAANILEDNYIRLNGAFATSRLTKIGRIQLIQKFVDLTDTLACEYWLVCVGKAADSLYRLVTASADIDSGDFGAALDDEWIPDRNYVILNSSAATIPSGTKFKVFFNAAIESWEYYPDTTPLTWIKFTLTTDLTSTGSATITTTSDATNWPTTTAITVTNYSAIAAYSGAIGTAILIGTIWYVVEVNRPPGFIQANLSCNSHDWTSGDSARGFTADQVTPITWNSMLGLGNYPTNFFSHDIEIENPYNLNWLDGDDIIAERSHYGYDVYYVVKVLRQKCMRFRFELTADAPTGLTPNLTATAICPVGEDSGPPPSGSLTLKDIYGIAHNAKDGHKGVACYDFNNDWYFVEHCQHISTRFIGTLQATLSGGAATISVTPVTALNGVLPSGTQTVYNKFSWDAGTTGHNILVEWDPVNGQWFTNQMRCPS